MHMKRATPIPYLLLVILAVVALLPVHGRPPAIASSGDINSGDVAWMLTASALVLLMTPGLSFFYGGMVGFKNVVSTMLQSVVALGVISLVWVLVGYSLAFGEDLVIGGKGGFVGNPLTHLFWDNVSDSVGSAKLGYTTIPLMLFALFQL